MPIAWYFGFKKEMSIKGLWFGPTFAVIFLTIAYNCIIATVDWKALLFIIEKRTQKENESRAKIEDN